MRPADVAIVNRTREALASGAARAARVASGARQSDVAGEVGVSRSAIGHWETGTAVPSAEHALAYGRLLARLGKRAA